MPRGGLREPKGGRPPGRQNNSTLRKQAIRERWLARLEKDVDPLYDSMSAAALGTKYLVTRDTKTGKFINLDADKTALMLKCGMAEQIEVWDHLPSVQAFVALSDRAIDKPSEHMELSGEGGGPVVFKWES